MSTHVLHGDYPAGVVEVFDASAYKMDHPSADIVTCGACGRSWDDAVSSTWTPAPSARCPFEYDHRSEPESNAVSISDDAVFPYIHTPSDGSAPYLVVEIDGDVPAFDGVRVYVNDGLVPARRRND